MTHLFTTDFPSGNSVYTDEFGTIDREVYDAAKEIWKPAKQFAGGCLNDSQRIENLMLKAVAKVSRVKLTNKTEIKELRSYVFQTYKRLILAELKKDNNHRNLLDNWNHEHKQEFLIDEEAGINKKILINELRRMMDSETREIFDLLQLGYTFEELVPKYGKASNIIRSRYHKKTAKLVREIQTRMKDAEAKIKYNK